MNLRQFNSVSERRKALEEVTKVSLNNIGTFSLDDATASTKNCENMIGVTQVPLGIAGPLLISTYNQQPTTDNYFLPLATTEGALIASISRGCKVITECGGSNVIVERIGMSRGPVFRTKSLIEGHRLKEWVNQHQQEIAEVAERTSSHLKYLSSSIQMVGNLVFVRFSFDTQDAMGMNMVTIASQAIAELITEKTAANCLSVSGNFCVDKKPSWQNTISGRGFRAWSEIFIPTNILTSVLKVTARELFGTWEAKCLIGSAISGTMGFNGHAANIVAAIYLATGQDIAHVVEGSSAVTTMEIHQDGIFVRVFMPSVIVGTVGGGTTLQTQKESLELLGVAGGNQGKNSEKLAGIVAAAVLAGEVSELAALASGTLTEAHERLARRKS